VSEPHRPPEQAEAGRASGTIDPQLFRLLMACRWPLALVLSAWALAVAAIQILRQPIPIALPLDQPFPVRLAGPIQIEGIAQPVKLEHNKPLAVVGQVNVERTVAVKAADPLPVRSSEPLAVQGDVAVQEIKKPVDVAGIAKEIAVQVNNDEPLQVQGNVDVNQIGGRLNVTLNNAIKSLSPIPLP